MGGHFYVHIPFCSSRCAYCDFVSEPIGPHLRSGRVHAYVERLREELRQLAGTGVAGENGHQTGGGAADRALHRAADRIADRVADGGARPLDGSAPPFKTIYLGGGTPTALPRALLLPLVSDLADLQRAETDPEFTIEANPGTIDESLVRSLAAAGVTRVSLGVQSFSGRLRAVLGRRTEQRALEEALHDLRRAAVAGDVQEWNVDLIFGIPGATWEEGAADIDAAMAACPTHISLYDLTYTPAFAARVAKAEGAGAREAAGALAEQSLSFAAARLKAGGYRRYEISNFAVPGHECRHNQAYWQGEDYVGAGAAAVSTVGLERRTNPLSVAAYLAGEGPVVEALSVRTRLWERAMLGLRTADGVDELEVLPVLDLSTRDRLIDQECLQRACGRLRLNPAFLDVSNTVISALLAPPEEL